MGLYTHIRSNLIAYVARPGRRMYLRVLAAATVSAFALVVVAPAGATFPGKNGRIAYDSSAPTGSGLLDVWSIRPDGTRARNLTDTPTLDDYWPSFSADGDRIAFAHHDDVAVMRSDGTHLRTLTDGPERGYGATFSPNGKKIAWNGINVMRSDGSHQHSIGVSGGEPSWSPNGKWILYVAPPDLSSSNSDLWKVRPDGSGARNLTETPTINESDPDWSPDGRSVIYTHQEPASAGDIWAMRSNGSHAHAVIETAGSDLEPTFSPNGKLIAWMRSRSNRQSQIWTATTRGRRLEQLTTGSFVHEFPTWQAR